VCYLNGDKIKEFLLLLLFEIGFVNGYLHTFQRQLKFFNSTELLPSACQVTALCLTSKMLMNLSTLVEVIREQDFCAASNFLLV
jgi:hypothetical protein